MEWLKIDMKNLPEKEVLAANFKPRSYGYKEKLIGYLNIRNGIIECENEHEMLFDCTHYIDLDAHDIAK